MVLDFRADCGVRSAGPFRFEKGGFPELAAPTDVALGNHAVYGYVRSRHDSTALEGVNSLFSEEEA